jgi:hypothetical protein
MKMNSDYIGNIQTNNEYPPANERAYGQRPENDSAIGL